MRIGKAAVYKYILLLLTLASLAWLHWVVHRFMRRATPHLENQFDEHR